MDYLLKASGIIFLLFIFYTLFLKNETFYKSIRAFFSIGLLITIAIPLVEIPIYVEAITHKISLVNYTEVTKTNFSEQNIDWVQIIMFAYLIGVALFSLKFIVQLISLGNLFSNHQLIKKGKYYSVETTKNISPFSFFNIIIYNKNQFSTNELQHIINHEKAHVQQWHSIDVILSHLLVITLWFNPFVWLYKKAVQQNLEFLADTYALELTNNNKLYLHTLLKTCSTNYCTEITNNFYNSLLKKRIVMLHKNKSKNKNQWKYTLLLPMLIAFVLTFNTQTIAQEKKLIEIEEVNNLNLDLIIDKNSTNENLKKETAFFKKQFDINITFKGIKRNINNEITAIKIDAKGKDLKAKFENSGTEAIKPIKISYDSENMSISIGNLSTLKNSYSSYTIHTDENEKFNQKIHKKANFVLVKSGGKTKIWTIEDGKKEKIIVREIHKNDNKNHVWVNKGDENIKVEVIEDKGGEYKAHVILGDTKEQEMYVTEESIFIIKEDAEKGKKHKIKKVKFTSDDGKIKAYNIDEDNASENIFIVEKDGKLIQEKKRNNVLVLNSNLTSPLYIIDGEEVPSKNLNNIDADTIEKIEVLKGEAATKKYGKKGKNGVIIITTKKE